MLGCARSAPLASFGKTSRTSPRWADFAVGSDDDESDVEIFGTQLPTVLEDSYRSKPDSALEDSKTGVNAAMRALTPTCSGNCKPESTQPKVQDDGSPKDFGFLLQGKRQCADLESSQLDLDESEAGLDHRHLEILMSASPAQLPRSKQKRRKSGTADKSLRKRGRVSPAGHPGTPKSRCISDSMSEKSEQDDSGDGASVGGCSVSTLDRNEMPEATEEEWLRREDSRVKAIEMGKATIYYQRFCMEVPEEKRDCVLQTPDPYDRTISKRKWKEMVQDWRKQLWKHFGEAEKENRRNNEDTLQDTSKTEQGEPEGV